MKNATIAFIGAGNMASSLIQGLVSDGYDPQKIWATNPSTDKLEILAKNCGIQTTQDNAEATRQADIVVLAVKPNTIPLVAKGLADVIREKQSLVVSIAAGIDTAHLEKWLGYPAAIVRCMPNTPALVQTGATGLYASAAVSDKQREQAESLMRSVGIVVWLDDEVMMNTLTALSGSGPAYFFLVMEALQDAATQMGLPEDMARLLTLQTANGAARLALSSEQPLAELRRQVTSPGGTTEQAINTLEEAGIRAIFQRALEAAKKRAGELTDSISEAS